MIKVSSKTIDHSILQEVVDRFVDHGLLANVRMRACAELRKTSPGFKLSIMPLNSWYTKDSHVTNEDFDRIVARDTALGKIIYGPRGRTFATDEKPIIEILKGTKLIEFTRARGATNIFVEVSDAYIWIEFEKPYELMNWGLKRGYIPEPRFIELMKREDAQRNTAQWL